MNFQEFEQSCICYNCNAPLTRPKPIDHFPDKEIIALKCNCVHSFKIPYDPLNSFLIHLPICDDYFTVTGNHPAQGCENIKIPFIVISVDTGRETFEVKFLSPTPSLEDNSKYFRCDYIPDWMSLPKDELIKKLEDMKVFL